MKKYTKDTIKFYDKNIKAYTTSHSAVVLKSQINKFIKEVRGDKILDVACGPGHDTNYLTKKGFDSLGIDLSKKMISYAKKNFKGKFKLMDFFNLKFQINIFDGIWCSSGLTHVKKKDLNKILREFSRVLKKGGTLGIIVPKAKKRILGKKNDKRIFTMFHKKEIEEYLIKNKFKIISSEIFSYTYNRIKWILIVAKLT